MPRTKILSGVVAFALVAAGSSAIQTPAIAAPAPAGRAPATATATHTVTLVTGDVVTVTTLAGGEQIADVDRPDAATGGVHVRESGGDLYVLPEETLPLLAQDRLDRRLFNVSDLIEMGYDDARTAAVPLIATYDPRKRASTPAGARLVRPLTSIGGAALAADKKRARAFWTAAQEGGAVTKLWLDGRVEAALAESVPQVGAPAAWTAGYTGAGVTVAVLDTGVDATHPDLVGQVEEAVSFVPGEDASDVNGHGTHVASTVAGTGAASGGALKGVAPGADLIVGKVLADNGFGADSWVLAGMEWAAESGADVVSMSLGDSSVPSDGTDPLSAAVDALSARYGALFVIAAGNDGPESIGAPGAAASALTVGAVDKQDVLADFSSTGPVAVTGAIKPDIAAPGVDINAARSQRMDDGGSGLYWTSSGTSMATPHVSGAAAILAQRHPDWSGQQLKDALMSSAKGLDFSPYEVGTGRLDVAAAVENATTATGSVYFGAFDWPHGDDAPVDRAVTFTNDGVAARTLRLAAAEPFSAPAEVTVPAGGSASVTVTADPGKVGPGRHTGHLVGTDAATGAAVTRTSLGLVKEDERYDLRLKVTGRDGRPAKARVLVNKAGEPWPWVYEVAGEQTLRLPPDTYTVASYLEVRGERADSLGIALLTDPEVVLDRSTLVALDARKARLLDTAAPTRTVDTQRRIDFAIRYADGSPLRDAYTIPVKYDDLYVTPTDRMTQGSYVLATRWRKRNPALTVRLLGVPLLDATVQPGSTLEDGSARLRTVYAGTGAASEYSTVDAKGKAVVVTRSDAVSAEERAAAAVAAGARLLLVVNDGIGALNEYVGEVPIPIGSVHRDAGRALVFLARAGAAVRVDAQPAPTEIYDLTRNYEGAVPDRPLVYRPSHRDLARIDARYYAVRDTAGGGYRYDMTFTPAVGFKEREWYPGTRTEWVTPGQVWHEQHDQHEPSTWNDAAYRNAYARGSTTRLDWFAPATRPAFGRAFAVQNGRYRDYLTVNVQTWTPSGDTLEHGGYIDWGEVPTHLRLYQGGRLLHENRYGADLQWEEVPAGTLPYHLVLDASRPADPWRLSTRTHTEWDFVSSANDADDFVPFALLQLDYRVETDLRGDVPAGTTQRVGLRAGPQPGGSGTGRLTSVTLDVSYDDGASWQKVVLRKGDGGWWDGLVKLAKRPGGYVSVRASAATDAGWRISQEIIRAYGLS